MTLLRIGSNIRQIYEVERFIGEGAFAEVYRVKHKFLGRQAMKVFKMLGMTLAEAPEMLAEAIMLSRIGHPNVIRVFDAGVVDTAVGECAYFTMEHVAGGTLEDFWKSHGATFVPIETSVDILRQICRGLSVAHSQDPPIIHRDIKPQNILVGYDASGLRVRVSDFGLAKRVNPLTLLASARGTRRFKAPEIFRDPQSDSRAGDVWALGCVLYLLLTDRLPFNSVSDDELEGGAFASLPLVAPSALNHKVNRRLDEIVVRALATSPQQRYTSAQDFLADLETWKPTTKRRAGSRQGREVSDFGKEALGPFSGPDEAGARKLAEEAIRLARTPGNLVEAADLMEEALKKSPQLRDEYEYLIQLWRKGVAM